MPENPFALMSLAEAEAYIGVESGDKDALIQSLIDSATVLIEDYCQNAMVQRVFMEHYSGGIGIHKGGSKRIFLKHYPIVGLTTLSGAITDISPATGGTLSVASNVGLDAVGKVQVDLEEITYTGKSGTTGLTGITRGSNSSIAAAHAIGARVSGFPSSDAVVAVDDRAYTMPANQYVVWPEKGILEHYGYWYVPQTFTGAPGRWTISYSAGRFVSTAAVAPVLKTACGMLVAARYQMRTIGLSRKRVGEIDLEWDRSLDSYGVPMEIQAMIGPYISLAA